MSWKSFAPSNIALIKYMGKEPGNRATNPSLSMTLKDFRTEVEISPLTGAENDRWRPLPNSAPLREESTVRFVKFFQRLKAEAGVEGFFELKSGNNFPSDAGLASSASSFAALTRTAHMAFAEILGKPMPSPEALAKISQTGSGSSCRSFFSPWCAWEGEKIGPVENSLPPLVDFVAVIETGFKKVSSSEAHQRVRTSDLFSTRSTRVENRMKELTAAMKAGNLPRVAEISWAELWDMHSLFHTSVPPFSYFSPGTVAMLRWVEERWEKEGKGPIATIDAGPNVHLLVPVSERERYRALLGEAHPGIKFVESEA
ncbi:MAG: diphosphomevalonate/mevalonate 3,5-bisphosphate decarboxylase family protein [Bacteriovoracia bacterium]